MSLPLVDLGPLVALDPATAPELTAVIAPAEVPVALLPVRLETRFAEAADGSTELLVRVYPDKIHLDAHDPRLSAVEADAGRAYWQAEWRSGTDETRLRVAWRGLTDRFGPERAAWIARRLTPTNPAARPDQAIGPEEALSTEPAFPDPGPPAERTATPATGLLPDRWTACAYAAGGLLSFATGADIQPDLPVGPDLDAPLLPSEDGPVVDAGMAWMVDFAKAELAGMALRLPLPGPITRAQVDVLLVSGVRADDPSVGAEAYADLLAAQRFTDGLSFLAPGTPSNNSTEERSGYASRDLRGEQSFALEWRATAAAATTNAGRSQRALGLAESDLDHLAGAADDHDRLSAAMQAALWPGTWGYYLTQFIGLLAGRLTLDDLDWARDFVAHWLRPGGPLPAIRVGRQPNGVLPVTSLQRYTATGADAVRFGRLRNLLVGLRDVVWRPALADVPRIGRGSDPNADLVDVLRTDALGNGLAVRRAMGQQYVQNLGRFLGAGLVTMGFWTRLHEITGGLPSRLGLGVSPSIGGLVWEPAARPVALPLVGVNHRAMINALLGDNLAA
ncbi:MAG TPA: hypothetical protein VK925_08635, partial [Jiangellaceae bacterium]|nr:hypothetical protein [Jiangellaceae bacterium]